MPCSRTVGDVETVTREKDVTSALQSAAYVIVVPTDKVKTLVLCMAIDKENLPPCSCRNVEMRNHLEDKMKDLLDVHKDSVVRLVVDTDNTK